MMGDGTRVSTTSFWPREAPGGMLNPEEDPE